MNRRQLMLFIFLSFFSILQVWAQSGEIKGKVVSRGDRQPIIGATVTLSSTPESVVKTSSDGAFSFKGVDYNTYKMTIQAQHYSSSEINVRVNMAVNDLNFITLVAESANGEAEDFAFSEYDTENENEDYSSATMLTATKDAYDQASAYTFSSMRFRNRGYESSSQDVYMNGILMNDALTGSANWSLWGGLNDATRNQEYATRLNSFEYGVGGINGTTNINARASQIRKGFRSSIVTANGQYRARVMLSYGSGNLDNGWSYAITASTRQGGNDYVKGVGYNSWAYFASVEKEINEQNRISLSVFGSPSERSVQSASTQEVYDLVGSNYYNANWGWQDGKRRNARVRKNHEPVAMLNYLYTPDENTSLNVTAAFRFGKNGYSSLDWYDAADPKPDYHKNLPSYYYYKEEYAKGEEIGYAWMENYNNIRHINWDNLYNVNYNSKEDWGEYNGVNMGAGRAKYILSERHVDQKDLNLKVTLAKIINSNNRFNIGTDLKWNRTEYYNQVKDLLGADYWLNIDNFAERDFSGADFESLMNDKGNTNNLIVKEGDKYGYDYYANVRNAKLWANYNYNMDALSVFAAAEGGYTSLWREGKYTKGLFPEDSKGDSEKQDFFTYTVKAGATYEITPTQNISLSGVYMEKAPYFQDVFISPRTRNEVVPNLTTEKTMGGDITYSAKLPFMNVRVSGFYTLVKDQTKLVSYYDDLQNSFTNFAMSGIDQRYAGAELGFKIPLIKNLSLNGALSYGDYIYDSNAKFTQTRDNSAAVLHENETVYWKGMKVESTPQTAASIGLNYRTDSYWFFGIDCNYFDRMYLSMSPLLRTDYAIDGLDYEASVAQRSQEKFDDAFVVNADISKSWYINRKYNFGFSLQVKNLLNTKNIKTGGYEQMRLREIEEDSGSHRQPFDSKYFYMYGTTYYANLYFRF